MNNRIPGLHIEMGKVKIYMKKFEKLIVVGVLLIKYYCNWNYDALKNSGSKKQSCYYS